MHVPRRQGRFSEAYRGARANFLRAASQASSAVEHHVLPALRGSQGEELALDTALICCGVPNRPVVVVSSGVHGVEGICGSGCQTAMLDDDELVQAASKQRVDLLFLHAVNPHGFSFLRRVNEDNVDINRNFLDFSGAAQEANTAYADLHRQLLPAHWPPGPEQATAIASYIEHHGITAYRRAVTTGQQSHPDGMFYSGARACWSNTTVRSILRRHVAERPAMAWIDLHTGLGPTGHGEKIHSGAMSPANLAVARTIWGADVVAAWEGVSVSEQVSGHMVSSAHAECPRTEWTGIGLEFGTVPYEQFMDAIRGDHWLHRSREAESQRAQAIKQAMVDAFYVDSDEWRGMVVAQCRLAILQACFALGREA